MKFTLVYAISLVALLLINDASAKKKGSSGFCRHKTLEDGTQIKSGSCSTTIQGDIPRSSKMTSSLITSPESGAIIQHNTEFNVDVLVDNLDTGHFNDPDKQYYTDPQELNDKGVIKGHTHITIQKLDGERPPNAEEFEFFEGLNDKAKDGRFTVKVVREDGTPGLLPGKYRICTISSSKAHQPVIMPVAKRGAQDDCIRIDVVVSVNAKSIQNDPKAKQKKVKVKDVKQ